MITTIKCLKMCTFFLSSLLFTYICIFIFNTNGLDTITIRTKKLQHKVSNFSDGQIRTLSSMSNIPQMQIILDNILIPRVVGTPEHTKVKEYIIGTMRSLRWDVQTDKFEDQTPIFGKLAFENIIAKLNPHAERYLALACHYDSKYINGTTFLGATDSAVPCAQMINLAYVMDKQLQSLNNNEVSLMLIFFDGEEAFKTWTSTDSLYGARHLAAKWDNERDKDGISKLDRMDILILLDLIGARSPKFHNYLSISDKWYLILREAEIKLASLRSFENYTYGKPEQQYFQSSKEYDGEDDHVPFLNKNVSVLHLIPTPFPSVWHTAADNRDNIDVQTIENLNKILRVFVSSYLKMSVHATTKIPNVAPALFTDRNIQLIFASIIIGYLSINAF